MYYIIFLSMPTVSDEICNHFQTQMVSFQCSPIATADGVLSTFRQCAIIQLGKDEDKFVSVAVLDEIGLAEDSPRMPLKVQIKFTYLFA